MANPHLSTTLAAFEAHVHDTKDRLVSIPASVQRRLRLARQTGSYVVFYSIRPKGRGHWNHQLAFLNGAADAFAISSNVAQIGPGDAVEVKLHRVMSDADALEGAPPNAGSVLLELVGASDGDDREDGSQNVDEYLNDLIRHG